MAIIVAICTLVIFFTGLLSYLLSRYVGSAEICANTLDCSSHFQYFCVSSVSPVGVGITHTVSYAEETVDVNLVN